MHSYDDVRFSTSKGWQHFAVVNTAAEPQAIVRFYDLGGCDTFIDNYQTGIAGLLGGSWQTTLAVTIER